MLSRAPKRKDSRKKKSYKFGILAEKIVIFFLFMKGYKILKARYKTRFGEIDIIAQKSKVLIIVEVKARRLNVSSEESLNIKQIYRIKKAAEFFISQNAKFQNHNLRFDFVEVNKLFIPKHHANFMS